MTSCYASFSRKYANLKEQLKILEESSMSDFDSDMKVKVDKM